MKHFSVTQEAKEPFEEERQTPPTAAPPAVPPPATDLPDKTIELLSSTSDEAPVNADIVRAGRLTLTAEDIIDLCARGLEIDDDNEPVEENQGPPPPVNPFIWLTPTTCHRKSAGHLNTRGRWANHPWHKIKEYDELALFLMTFPKEYITKTLLPTLNISLKEYVRWLGLTFFMACFEGVSNRKEWWSNSEPTREPGAPFRLINWMT